jgi:hypothetical protein
MALLRLRIRMRVGASRRPVAVVSATAAGRRLDHAVLVALGATRASDLGVVAAARLLAAMKAGPAAHCLDRRADVAAQLCALHSEAPTR